MDLFYIAEYIPGQQQLLLPPDESHHVKRVLRKKKGDILHLTDGRGHELSGMIQEDRGTQLLLQLQKQEKIAFPPENLIEVAISTIRPNRMDWAVEKLTELGVQTIIPLHCFFTSYRQVKSDHLRKIAVSAMKQSGQFYLPEIRPAISFSQWLLETGKQNGLKFLAHPSLADDVQQDKSMRDKKKFLAVGPEGGFHPDEISQARQAGFQILPLGQTILRTETAAISGVIRLKFLKNH
jgi:16S rRNA (uracil1498-N3)-methyltransferase